MLDFTQPHHIPCHNILSNLVYAASGHDVVLTMVRGKILYAAGNGRRSTSPPWRRSCMTTRSRRSSRTIRRRRPNERRIHEETELFAGCGHLGRGDADRQAARLPVRSKTPLNYIIGETGSSYFYNAYRVYDVLLMISTTGLPVAMSRMISGGADVGNHAQIRKIYKTALYVFLTIGIVGSLGCSFQQAAVRCSSRTRRRAGRPLRPWPRACSSSA